MSDNTTDRELIELLPWYVNGTLGGEERLAVEELLRRSPEARAEKAMLESLQAHAKAEWQSVAPGELGWKRLQKTLHTQAASTTGKRTEKRWRRFLATAAVLLVCLQVAIYFRPVDHSPVLLLGHDEMATQLDVQLFRIVIKQDAPWGEIEQLLFTLQARVVDGPSALGVITLAVPKEADPDTVLRQLATARHIEHAQVVSHE